MDYRLEEVPIPMGVEPQTIQLAKSFRERNSEFFQWIQEVNNSSEFSYEDKIKDYKTEIDETDKLNNLDKLDNLDKLGSEKEVAGTEPWLLSKWDIEYFHGLVRPPEVGCACPFGWFEKVERIIDQQYPVFGVERFPNLYDKAAHILWLIIKNDVFPSYNEGIGILTALVLLGRNGYSLNPSNEKLLYLVKEVDNLRNKQEGLDEELVIKRIGLILKV